jgi:hypothetical protein
MGSDFLVSLIRGTHMFSFTGGRYEIPEGSPDCHGFSLPGWGRDLRRFHPHSAATTASSVPHPSFVFHIRKESFIHQPVSQPVQTQRSGEVYRTIQTSEEIPIPLR